MEVAIVERVQSEREKCYVRGRLRERAACEDGCLGKRRRYSSLIAHLDEAMMPHGKTRGREDEHLDFKWELYTYIDLDCRSCQPLNLLCG